MKLLAACSLPVALALCGCAHLTVDVNVLDRKFWSSPEQLSSSISEQVANMMRLRANGQFAKARQTINSQAREALSQWVKVGAVDPKDVDRFVTLLAKLVDDGFNASDKHFESAFKKLGAASAGASPQKRLSILFEAQGELDAGYDVIRKAQQQMSVDLRTTIDGFEKAMSTNSADQTAVKAAVSSTKLAESKIQAAVASLGFIGDRGILDDPLASNVVYAPESYWIRPESPHGINNTSAKGNFGNTDIAIKMETVGDFTIKGVRLDASKITQAIFAVGRQAIKTVAGLYGIPLSKSGGTQTTASAATTPFAETSIGFDAPDRRRGQADEALLFRRVARLTVLETILVQRQALTNPKTTVEVEAARATAIKTVKDVFAANRVELDAPTAPTK